MSASVSPHHLPVLAAEVVELLAPASGETWVDATVGAGGHTRLLAARVGSTGLVIGLDCDAAMLKPAKERLAGLPVKLAKASFDELDGALRIHGVSAVDGVLADLGICSDQLDDPNRGLSFQQEGPLDMRLDASQGETAAQLLARLSERELANVIFEFGEERHSRRIAKRIVEARKIEPIRTTSQLADLVRRSVPRAKGHGIDPATRTFQALRIAVNDELAALDGLLRKLPGVVRPGGRVGIISFHSLEDRRVKQAFRDSAIWELKTKKPVQTGEEEVRNNPRSRSAKLRVAIRK
ncbi:MAG TPA: 16S rRNA (cytosine(1402)-N(4))-methyltransferase RsmH [Gemmataceae bacterium]|jgi:16S rRNA (cytosine1402-N4)-methyltransferase|nr:16S rRNA (cytosine(1402)-N(4))-methyltransferase RsmH [Gemmataceae bacterium]